MASPSFAVTVDTTAPDAPILTEVVDDVALNLGSVTSGGTTNDAVLTVSGTADAGKTVTLYDTDGSTILGTSLVDAGGHWTLDTSVLGDGTHTLTAQASDSVGNVSGASAGFIVTVDAAAPTTPTLTGVSEDLAPNIGPVADHGTTHDRTLIVSGTGESGATVTLYDTNGRTVLGTSPVDPSGHWTLTTSILSNGTHTFTAKASDNAGNLSGASADFVVTVDAAPLSPRFADPVANDFGLDNVGLSATPTFADLDGDGDPDAFVGNSAGNLLYFENTVCFLHAPAF